MSEPHDPLDQAYVEAEALLDDEAARAARRERVLAAVASAPVASTPAPAPRRRADPRWAGWLAAAGVVGLTVFTVSQIWRPIVRTPIAPEAATRQAAPPPAPAEPRIARAPAVTAPEPATPRSPTAAPAAKAEPVAPAIPPVPAPAAPAPVVSGQRSSSEEARDNAPPPMTGTLEALKPSASAPAALAAPAPPPPPPPPPPPVRREAEATSSERGEALRGAAAAGRASDVETLLNRGVAVDAADESGDTALIKAVRSDRPAAARALRRAGASLDRRNRAGESARDLAGEKDDPALDRALGLKAPPEP
ncbi:MAG TPA: hypothetical protein VGH15_07850 [Caulobacteraceae bacterium]